MSTVTSVDVIKRLIDPLAVPLGRIRTVSSPGKAEVPATSATNEAARRILVDMARKRFVVMRI